MVKIFPLPVELCNIFTDHENQRWMGTQFLHVAPGLSVVYCVEKEKDEMTSSSMITDTSEQAPQNASVSRISKISVDISLDQILWNGSFIPRNVAFQLYHWNHLWFKNSECLGLDRIDKAREVCGLLGVKVAAIWGNKHTGTPHVVTNFVF